MKERIGFEEAINDEKLLKNHFLTLSMPQKVALKAFYGLELSGEPDPKLGYSELDAWTLFQGGAEFDDLGYPLKFNPIPYSPKEYDKLVAILGRRSGKTDKITATALAYEAVLGGHKQFVSANQDFIVFFIAQDIPTATSHLKFVSAVLHSSPLLAKQVKKENSDGIFLTNGLSILPQPPTIKSSRGYAIPVVVMDEVGFWYKDATSANPDFEVENAVEYAQQQFPFAKEFVTSTPWTEEGILHKAQQAGTEGVKIRCSICEEANNRVCPHLREQRQEHEGMLVLQAPTASMGNPLIKRAKLAKARRRNPEAFKRESLAQFTKSSSGFLPEAFVKEAIEKGVYSRPRFPRPDHPSDPSPIYIAAMDPAFRHDAFTFTILHHDPTVGIVQDRLLRLLPEENKPINPSEALDQIQLLLKEFNLSMVYSDQYQLESLQQLAQQRQFSIIGEDFTAKSKSKIYGSLEVLIKQKRIKLLDHPEIYDELVRLEKKRTPTGTVTIAAPSGKYDDVAAVIALATYEAVWMLTPVVQAKSAADPELESDHVKMGLDHIAKHRAELDEWAGGHEDD